MNILNSSDEFIEARKYDKMIPWEKRLKREIPFISANLKPGNVLDVACSSGRHSFALEKHGFQTVGIDISEAMISLANELGKESGSSARFLVCDASSDVYENLLKHEFPVVFNNAILLGNAIANLGTLEKGEKLMQNLFLLVQSEGRLIVQTVHRPSKPHYTPLRKIDNNLVQRIMIPVHEMEHNMELHVNIFDVKGYQYVSQKSDNKFYMYTREEFASLVNKIGWEVKAVYGGYSQEEVIEVDGATLVWILVKPEIPLYKETIDLFQKYSNIDTKEIKEQALKVWYKAMQTHNYHCIRGFRYLYPRIISHNRYKKISQHFDQKWILDIGCNMGTDIRKMIVDGADPRKIVGIDRYSKFIELGYELFKDKQSLRVKFYTMNVLDDEFLHMDSRHIAFLEKKFNIIHAGSMLHLLSKEENDRLLVRIYSLLDQNGIFFGRAVGQAKPKTIDSKDGLRHLYSPETLKQHLNNHGFTNIEITISAKDGPIGERSTDTYWTMFFYAEK